MRGKKTQKKTRNQNIPQNGNRREQSTTNTTPGSREAIKSTRKPARVANKQRAATNVLIKQEGTIQQIPQEKKVKRRLMIRSPTHPNDAGAPPPWSPPFPQSK